MDSVDKLSDTAMAAGKAACNGCSDDLHKQAKQAHEAAYVAASTSNRPSLAQHHLQEAAKHDRHADPTTPEGKTLKAKQASEKANASGKPEDHDAAASAHREASEAHRGASRGGIDVMHHGDDAFNHERKADQIRNPKPQPRFL